MLAALGDYAAAADPELLTARTFDAHPTGTADLFGLRLAVLHESDHGRRLAEGTVKRLTGGDRVKARRMREDFWSFDPSHTFVMLTNHKPVVGGTDEGIWRRLRLVPVGRRDPRRTSGTSTSATGSPLNWTRSWRGWPPATATGARTACDDPEPVLDATRAYRDESDTLGRFLDLRCLTGPHFPVRLVRAVRGLEPLVRGRRGGARHTDRVRAGRAGSRPGQVQGRVRADAVERHSRANRR